MALGLEVVGVVVLAVAMSRVVDGGGLSPAAATTMLLAIVAGVSFWAGLWIQGQSLVQAHSADDKLTLEQSNAAGGAVFNANEGFMGFADRTIPRNARVFVECGQHQASCGSEADWLGFRLTPRPFVSSPAAAQWAIFYNANPALEPFARGWRILPYAANFALAQAPG